MGETKFSRGDLVKCVFMPNDPQPVEAGTRGVVIESQKVRGVTPLPFEQVTVWWENGRTLMPCVPPDHIEKYGECDLADDVPTLEIGRPRSPARFDELFPERNGEE